MVKYLKRKTKYPFEKKSDYRGLISKCTTLQVSKKLVSGDEK
jgi:hypothetical protein